MQVAFQDLKIGNTYEYRDKNRLLNCDVKVLDIINTNIVVENVTPGNSCGATYTPNATEMLIQQVTFTE